MEQIIVILLFHQDHLLHKNKEERGKGTWPRIGMEHYPAGDIYLLASCSACEVLTGWEPASHRSAHGLLRQRPGGFLLLCGLSPSFSDQGLLSSCGVGASLCGGFYCGMQALGLSDFSSCGTWAQLPYGMRNLPELGIEPVSFALAGGFPTTGPL